VLAWVASEGSAPMVEYLLGLPHLDTKMQETGMVGRRCRTHLHSKKRDALDRGIASARLLGEGGYARLERKVPGRLGTDEPSRCYHFTPIRGVNLGLEWLCI
jgi:hypothetical protein